jgi:hypothetical protein
VKAAGTPGRYLSAISVMLMMPYSLTRHMQTMSDLGIPQHVQRLLYSRVTYSFTCAMAGELPRYMVWR